MPVRSPFISKKKQVEEAMRILQEQLANDINGKKKVIDEEEWNRLKSEGVIKERRIEKDEGATEAAILYIDPEECKKIPKAQVIGSGDYKACLIPLRRKGDEIEIKELRILED